MDNLIGCTYCTSLFSSTAQFGKHTCDPALMRVTCDAVRFGMCEKVVYNTRSDFIKHFTATHMKKSHCKVCLSKFTKEDEKMRHFTGHSMSVKSLASRIMIVYDPSLVQEQGIEQEEVEDAAAAAAAAHEQQELQATAAASSLHLDHLCQSMKRMLKRKKRMDKEDEIQAKRARMEEEEANRTVLLSKRLSFSMDDLITALEQTTEVLPPPPPPPIINLPSPAASAPTSPNPYILPPPSPSTNSLSCTTSSVPAPPYSRLSPPPNPPAKLIPTSTSHYILPPPPIPLTIPSEELVDDNDRTYFPVDVDAIKEIVDEMAETVEVEATTEEIVDEMIDIGFDDDRTYFPVDMEAIEEIEDKMVETIEIEEVVKEIVDELVEAVEVEEAIDRTLDELEEEFHRMLDVDATINDILDSIEDSEENEATVADLVENVASTSNAIFEETIDEPEIGSRNIDAPIDEKNPAFAHFDPNFDAEYDPAEDDGFDNTEDNADNDNDESIENTETSITDGSRNEPEMELRNIEVPADLKNPSFAHFDPHFEVEYDPIDEDGFDNAEEENDESISNTETSITNDFISPLPILAKDETSVADSNLEISFTSFAEPEPELSRQPARTLRRSRRTEIIQIRILKNVNQHKKDQEFWTHSSTSSTPCPRCNQKVGKTSAARKAHYKKHHYDIFFAKAPKMNDVERWVSCRIGERTEGVKAARVCLQCNDRKAYKGRIGLLKHMKQAHRADFPQLKEDYRLYSRFRKPEDIAVQKMLN